MDPVSTLLDRRDSDSDMAAPQIILPPAINLSLIQMKPGTYGISYDIYTAKTENHLPEGWDAPRGAQLTNLMNHKNIV